MRRFISIADSFFAFCGQSVLRQHTFRSDFYEKSLLCWRSTRGRITGKPTRYQYTLGLCVLALVSLAIATEATANPTDQNFPYTTYVLGNGSYVRSGPGKAYYPTERLKTGDAVEVYRHDPGGWLAIRPTKNSFTWVRSRYLRSLGDGLAEVTGSKVAARMGSHLKNVKDVFQVRLHKEETVELVDPKSLDGPQPEPWVKIRPPSGEFRWIHSSLVDRKSNASGLRRPHRSTAPIVPRTYTTPPEQRTQPRYERENTSRRSTPRTTRTSQYTNTPMHFAHDQRPQPNYQRASRGYSSPLETGPDFKEAIAELELELSKIVASDPETWSFNRVAMDAESLAKHSQTAVERGRIKAMLTKIDRFEEIQVKKERLDQMIARHEQQQRLAMQGSNYNRVATSARPGTTSPRAMRLAMTSQDNRFDGTGVLRRIKPAQKGAPNYALFDNAGRVLCYVTPTQDVPLSYYENRRIGVNGSRGYIPSQQNQHHVMVQRVQLLR